MQERFGRDFGGVRVHTGSRAAASAHDVGALAYTVGSHVVFGHGQYDPGTPRGQHLLSHELAHVVQQRNAHVDLDRLAIDGSTTSPAEREASAVADHVVSGKVAPHLSGTREGMLQRQPDLPNRGPAGGCGICQRPTTAGSQAHKLIQGEYETHYQLADQDPSTAPEGYRSAKPITERTLKRLKSTRQFGSAPGDENRRLDLALIDQAGEVYIGEIKPASRTQYDAGMEQLQHYSDTIFRMWGRRPKRMQEAIDVRALVMPNPDASEACPPQLIHLERAGQGLYLYYCKPTRREARSYPDCRCNRRRKEESERERKDVDIPATRAPEKAKDVRGPRAVDEPVQQPETPVLPPVEEPVREPPTEEPSEKPTEKPTTEPGDGRERWPPFPPFWVTPGGPGAGNKPSSPSKPWWEGEPANDNQEVEEKKKQLAAMVALGTALVAAAKMLPKGALKRFAGPVLLAMALIGCAKGGELTLGPGEDPLEALFKNAESQGVTIPDDIKDALDKDPELKKILLEAAQGGEKLTEAEAKIAEQLTRTVIENRDQFTEEELKALAEMSEKAKGAIPNADVTLEEIKKALAHRQAGTTPPPSPAPSPTPAPFAKPKTEGPTVTAGQLTIEGEEPAPPPAEEPVEAADIPPELKEQLQKDKPTRKLFEGLLSEEKGVRPSKELVEEFLAIVGSADPPLDDQAVVEMLKLVESSEGKTRAEALDTIRRAIAKRAAPPPGQAPLPPADPNAPKPEEKQGDAPQAPAPEAPAAQGESDPSAQPQPNKPVDAAQEKKIKKLLRDKKFVRGFTWIKAGERKVQYDPPTAPAKGLAFSGWIIGRTMDGELFLGLCTVLLGDHLEEDRDNPEKYRWWARVPPGVPLYTRNGALTAPFEGETLLLDWTKIGKRRKRAARRKKKK
jgi:hypothetical protein